VSVLAWQHVASVTKPSASRIFSKPWESLIPESTIPLQREGEAVEETGVFLCEKFCHRKLRVKAVPS
jgi:hypothetical protein